MSDNLLLQHHFVALMITCVTAVSLACLVFWKGKPRLTKNTYALYTAAIALWSGTEGLAITIADIARAKAFWQLSHSAVMFIPVFFVHFVVSLLSREEQRSKRFLVYSAYFYGFFYLGLNLAGRLVPEVVPKFYFKSYASADFKYTFFFAFWIFFASYGLIKLFRLYFVSDAKRKNQLGYFCLSTVLAYIGGSANFLPVFDLYIPVLIPFGIYAIPIYTFVAAYAIIARQLIDIRLAIKKTFYYFLIAILISVVYLLLVYGIHILFFKRSVSDSTFLAGLWSLIVIACLFKPVEMLSMRFLDKMFFKGSVAEIAEQKEKLVRELERRERLKSVGILASGMAHEIKNPITAIKTFLEYLPQKHNDPQFMDDFRRIVGNEIARINVIVQDLLDFAKPRPAVKVRTDINGIIRDTLELLSKDFIRTRINVVVHGTVVPLNGCVDPGQMKQALLNIVMNAIDAMKDSGGTLSVGAAAEDSRVKITIRDTGCGIDPDRLPLIFDPFYTQKDSGTGLGLAITHSIVEGHQGTIGVQSQVGKGTVFTISLPTG